MSPSDLPRPEIVAVPLTPVGRGAIATIRIEGSGVRERVTPWLRHAGGEPVRHWPTDRAIHAIWRHGPQQYEEVVAYSPQPWWIEIHCHGGTASVASIMRTLEATGCPAQPWSDWLRRQETTATRGEAAMLLPRAPTEMTAICLLDQWQGALDRELEDLQRVPAPADALDRLQALLETAVVGSHLTQPWRIALGGPPNVGKSSLINRLLGFQRALVFDIPGTTRDVLRTHSALAGWPVEWIDTPGWLESEDRGEQWGVQLGQSVWADADVQVLTVDATDPMASDWSARVPAHLIVWNKIDLPNAAGAPGEQLRDRPWLAVSALTGENCDSLLHEISLLLPAAPARHAPVLFTARQQDWIRQAIRCWQANDLSAGQEALRQCQQDPGLGRR